MFREPIEKGNVKKDITIRKLLQKSKREIVVVGILMTVMEKFRNGQILDIF